MVYTLKEQTRNKWEKIQGTSKQASKNDPNRGLEGKANFPTWRTSKSYGKINTVTYTCPEVQEKTEQNERDV